MQGLSWLADNLLYSQELCSMLLVIVFYLWVRLFLWTYRIAIEFTQCSSLPQETFSVKLTVDWGICSLTIQHEGTCSYQILLQIGMFYLHVAAYNMSVNQEITCTVKIWNQLVRQCLNFKISIAELEFGVENFYLCLHFFKNVRNKTFTQYWVSFVEHAILHFLYNFMCHVFSSSSSNVSTGWEAQCNSVQSVHTYKAPYTFISCRSAVACCSCHCLSHNDIS